MGPDSCFQALDWHVGFNLKGLFTSVVRRQMQFDFGNI